MATAPNSEEFATHPKSVSSLASHTPLAFALERCGLRDYALARSTLAKQIVLYGPLNRLSFNVWIMQIRSGTQTFIVSLSWISCRKLSLQSYELEPFWTSASSIFYIKVPMFFKRADTLSRKKVWICSNNGARFIALCSYMHGRAIHA